MPDPAAAGLPPLVGSAASSDPLEPLHPYLPPNIYDPVAGLVPDQPIPPPLPLPPRPSAAVEASVAVDGEASGPGFSMRVHANASEEVIVVPGSADGEPGQVPCADSRGCPDLVVDASRLLVGTIEERTFGAGDCAVLEGSTQAGERRLLRFTFTSVNVGDGDLRIGQAHLHPEWFQWGACHGHYHFKDYADYRLWTPEGYDQWSRLREAHPDERPDALMASHPELAQSFIAGHKQGFCAIDVWPYLPVEPQKYTNCFDVQGVSRGWADEYGFQLDGQWIDITGLAPGTYVLEAEANAGRLYQEMVYSNNSGAVYIAVPPAV